MGWAEISSSSSYLETFSRLEQNIYKFVPDTVLGPSNQVIDNNSSVFSEEIRFSSSLDGSLQFLTGLYYENVELLRG